MGRLWSRDGVIEYGETQRPRGVSMLTPEDMTVVLRHLFSPDVSPEELPFLPDDTTAGTETELQAAVKGRREDVDLPFSIEQSNYYTNIMRRVAAGDTSKRLITELERFLSSNTEQVWENSLVTFPRSTLTALADAVFRRDLRANKKSPGNGLRSDVDKFVTRRNGEETVRIPISYLIKLALADVISGDEAVPLSVRRTGYRLMGCFTNDNTSPETHSFHVVSADSGRDIGKAVAGDISTRFLLTQLLVMYANRKFKLKERGQEAQVYFSPHPPVRQRKLNGCISDSFYRDLFMSPCLSGWDEGETKHSYMHLCHEVLSRSQLNAVAKLREAGIILSNLVVLPNISNISLANNGTHLSFGSRRLSELLNDRSSGFTSAHEKYTGDLAVKIIEHFLPLFVGTYTASPYRIDFDGFHPEKVLGFLPHELDYTHLRMLWRRWKNKAQLKIFGSPVTPFGPPWLDRAISALFGLKGDLLPDFRLIDYLVCIMSTERSPALDGHSGNTTRLKKDLSDLGIFHNRMSLYLLYKPREFDTMGFSGFEGRYYSLFHGFERDMGGAARLQNLVTALAFKYIIEGTVTHNDIPDSPFLESERRQVIFDAAIGIPTFYVRADTGNLFLKDIVARTSKVRLSRRYPGYLRVGLAEYLEALLQTILNDGVPLIEMFQMEETMKDLKARLAGEEGSTAASRLMAGILKEANTRNAMAVDSDEFNPAAERFYRETLRKKHIEEVLILFEEQLRFVDRGVREADDPFSRVLCSVLDEQNPLGFLRAVRGRIIDGTASLDHIKKFIFLVLAVEHREETLCKKRSEYDAAPVYRAGNT